MKSEHVEQLRQGFKVKESDLVDSPTWWSDLNTIAGKLDGTNRELCYSDGCYYVSKKDDAWETFKQGLQKKGLIRAR